MDVGDPISWGRKCIEAGDLEPLDSALSHMVADGLMDRAQLSRWWIAFWGVYNIGAASYLSEQTETFWSALYDAAANDEPSPLGERWPRGAERRHWRGQNAKTAVSWMWTNYPKGPEGIMDFLYQDGDFLKTKKRAKSLPQFGEWASFDVVYTGLCHFGWSGHIPVNLDAFFRIPQQGAKEAGEYWGCTPDEALMRVMDGIVDVPVPPGHLTKRMCRAGEAETIFCKWMHASHGSYYIGKDTRDMHATLTKWSTVSPTAIALKARLPSLASFIYGERNV